MRAQADHATSIVDFDDNRLLPQLFGEHDRNLARIEKRLGVTVSTRGNRVALSGPEPGRRAAKDVLGRLYQRLR
ncbi:MAG: phosphate starvation-inducible protein PhoH, partial [Alphaproteobacteria bacterium]|nr:phosphate starvation-inducible protein PhoH [Alphaproteobacteria bacterium]